jgi:metal-responsive CopG/Arc/MetJ family transcriptional regulator
VYQLVSISLPDPKLLRRIKKVAKAQGISISAFIRDAAEKEVAAFERKNGKAKAVKAA